MPRTVKKNRKNIDQLMKKDGLGSAEKNGMSNTLEYRVFDVYFFGHAFDSK